MPYTYSSNKVLIEDLKEGNIEAFTYLMDTYHHKLCLYAYGLSRDHLISQDIVQNIFIRTWLKRKKLDSKYSINNFLYRAVYNEYIDQYRKNQIVFSVEKQYMETLTGLFDEEEDNSIERLMKLVKKEVYKLPPKCKQTFLLSKQDGLTNTEIAEYLNISTKTVEFHISTAFSILRKKLADTSPELILLLLFNKFQTEKLF